MSDDAATVLRQFRVVFNAVKTHFQQIERLSGLGGAQLWALSLVAERKGLGVGDLAEAMDIHQSTASNLVRALVSKQLLQSTRDAQDKRVVHLEISPEGMAILANAPGPFSGILPDALQKLDGETLQRLHGDLDRLINVLGIDGMSKAAQTPLANL